MSIEKNRQIAKTLSETRQKREGQSVHSAELKIDIRRLSKRNQEILKMRFVEAKWLRNYLISLPSEEFRTFDTKTRNIHHLDKDGNRVECTLTLPAKDIQSVYKGVKNDLASLKAKKGNGGKTGSLKFTSEVRCIDLNQYGNTHFILYGSDGDAEGKHRNTYHLGGLKGFIKVFGLEQIPLDAELANAKLIHKPSGCYIHQVYYLPKEGKKERSDKGIGLDFGIADTITTDDGRVFSLSAYETERLKGLQKKLERQIKGSRGWYKTKMMLKREYERLCDKKRDEAHKIRAKIRAEGGKVYIQDENLKGWHSGLFGKQVQHSAMGTLKRELIAYDDAYVLDRWFPSTKVCPACGREIDIPLSGRIFSCPCGYTAPRDQKSALVILLAGQYFESLESGLPCTPTEYRSTQVELTSDFRAFLESWKQSARKPEDAKPSGWH